MRGRHAGDSGTNDGDFRPGAGIRGIAPGGRKRDRGCRVTRFDSVLFRDKPLQRADRDRLIDASTTALHLARGAAHAAADRSKRVRRARNPVRIEVPSLGNRHDISPRICSDRASPLAFDLALPVLDVGDLDPELAVTHWVSQARERMDSIERAIRGPDASSASDFRVSISCSDFCASHQTT